MFLAVQPALELAAQDVQKFFAFVRIGFAAPSTGTDAEEVRLHGHIAPGKKLHTHAAFRLQDFSLLRTHEAGILAGGLKEGEDVRVVKARDPPKSGDRRAHLPAFPGPQKARGNVRGARHLRQRKTAPRPNTPQAL